MVRALDKQESQSWTEKTFISPSRAKEKESGLSIWGKGKKGKTIGPTLEERRRRRKKRKDIVCSREEEQQHKRQKGSWGEEAEEEKEKEKRFALQKPPPLPLPPPIHIGGQTDFRPLLLPPLCCGGVGNGVLEGEEELKLFPPLSQGKFTAFEHLSQ